MNITYNTDQNRFVISCAFHENGLIAQLPNKRWQKTKRVWYAPALHRNAQFLIDHCAKHMDEHALQVARKSIQRSERQAQPFPAWYKFNTPPYRHQQEALDFAWSLPAHALAMEMGTGKTKVAIDLHVARMQAQQINTWLIFCPNTIRDNWLQEIKTHSPIPIETLILESGMSKTQCDRVQKLSNRAEPLILIAGYESLSQKVRGGSVYSLIMNVLEIRGPFAVTCDESHMVKTPDANRTQNVVIFAELAKMRQIMTGTLITKNILDLYQQYEILDPNIIGIGSWYSFRNRYVIMDGYDSREIMGYQNLEELMGLIKPYTFRKTKADSLDLPDKLYSRRSIKLTKEQMQMYKNVKNKPKVYIGDREIKLAVDRILAEYNALQQVTGGFIKYDHENPDGTIERKLMQLIEPSRNPKIIELVNIATEASDSKIIVWAKFRQEIEDIVSVLRDRFGPDSVSEYHGGIDVEQRALNIQAFKTGPARFFVANQQTGGTGLTINESNLVVFYSNTFKLVDRQQSEDRNHRIGQKNDVLYIDLVCSGTIDAEILRSLADKKDVAEYIKSSLA